MSNIATGSEWENADQPWDSRSNKIREILPTKKQGHAEEKPMKRR